MKTTFFEPDRPDAIWTVKQVASVIELHIDQRVQTFSKRIVSCSIVLHIPELAFGTVDSCVAKEPSQLVR